jgi:predicted homoserine dehydrogenase-like protein
MLELLRQLDAPVRLGIVGMGAMGKGLLYQVKITPGFNCVAINDIVPGRAEQCAAWLGIPFEATGKENGLDRVIGSGKIAVTEDPFAVAKSDKVEVFIEASSGIVESGMYCKTAIEHGKHVIMMNAEADLAFGPYLLSLARQHGVVYTSCDGDQPGIIKHLYDRMVLWGFEPVMAGNIKGFLDRYSNPVKIIPEADKRRLDYKMATAYTDGTKLNIEMSLVANALNMKTIVPGMFGHVAKDIKEVFSLFDFEKLWQDRVPFVDYIVGAEPGGGVFTVGYCENEYQQFMMNYYKMGNGPFYLFYRPYHLCHVESMEWIARAYIYKEALLRPDYGFKTNVIAYAKKDLQKGEQLDGLGGFTCYGMIENGDEYTDTGLPACIAENITLLKSVRKDERIGISDVDSSGNESGFELHNKSLQASLSLIS